LEKGCFPILDLAPLHFVERVDPHEAPPHLT
jgi:hypothetical protein